MSKKSRLLIVNADDFGLSNGINSGIIHAHKHGILTSATLLAGLEGSEEAACLARENRSLGVGIHLNYNLTPPVRKGNCLPFSSVKELANYPVYFFWLPFILNRKAMAELKDFFRYQVEWGLKRKLEFTHLDTHKHIHLLPPVTKLVCQVAREFGIKAVRFPWEPFWKSGRLNPATRMPLLVSTVFSQMIRRIFREYNIKSPDNFEGIVRTGGWYRDAFLKLLKTLPYGVTEVMVHPGYARGLNRVQTRLILSRETELRILTDGEVRNCCRCLGIELVNYGIFATAEGMNEKSGR